MDTKRVEIFVHSRGLLHSMLFNDVLTRPINFPCAPALLLTLPSQIHSDFSRNGIAELPEGIFDKLTSVTSM